MKNLLGSNEFRQLKELQMLKESMDFSNKIGWSDSLVGRAVNKIFSFGAKQVQIIILKRLKVKLEDQYLMAILEAYALQKKEIPQSEGSNVAEISIKMTNKDTNTEITTTNISEREENITYIYKLPKGKRRDEYKIELISMDGSSWSIDGNKNAQIENIQEENKITVTSQNTKVNREYIIKVTEEVEEEKQQPALGQGEKSQGGLVKVQQSQNPKYELMKHFDISKEIEQYQDFSKKDFCYTKFDYSIMLRLDNAVEKEIQQMQKYVNLLEKATETEEIKKWKENLETIKQNIPNFQAISKSIKEKISNVPIDKKINHSDDKINSVIEGLSEESANEKFKELGDLKDKIIQEKPHKKEEIEKYFRKNAMPLHPDTTKNYTPYQRYVAYDNIKSAYDKLLVEKISYDDFQKIFEKFETMQPINESVVGNYKIKNLFNGYKKTTGLEKNLNTDMGSVDLDQMKKDFDSNPNLRQSAINAVNKEALKEIALRAQWLYDTEKYEDKRNTHYTRVNFTTTNMDQKKLENKWLQLVAKAKSIYAPFFSTDNKMPQELDPIALINSDKSFRTRWDQYSKEEADTKGKIGNKGTLDPEDTGVLKRCKLKKIEKIAEGQIGLFEIQDSTRTLTLDIMLNLIMIGDLHVFKFIGLFDFNKIYKEVQKNENLNDKEIQAIIEKYNYSGIGRIDKIQDPKIKNEITLFYNFLHPENDQKFKNDTQFIYDKKGNGDNLATFFISNENIEKSSKLFTQLNIIENKGNWLTKTDIKHEIVQGYIKIENDNNNVGIKNTKLKLSGNNRFLSKNDENFWQVNHPKDVGKTKLLTDNEQLKTLLQTKLKS